MELSDGDRDLLLAGLFELSTHADDETRERCRALARRLGGDPDAKHFVSLTSSGPEAGPHLPGVDDEADGIYYPHAVDEGDEALAESMLAGLLAECVTNGRHHLATLDHPQEGMVIGCTHCHQYWRPTR